MIASVPQADPPNLGPRIVRLFRPHRGVLALIVAMILVTSVLSVISALLVRRVFDHALFVAYALSATASVAAQGEPAPQSPQPAVQGEQPATGAQQPATDAAPAAPSEQRPAASQRQTQPT